MSNRRDHLFPSTSIGRTQGSRIPRTPSHESLTAHPLLSPTTAIPPSPEHAPNANGVPRYVPYTPRQRVAPTAATTGTTAHPGPSSPQADATTKLQLMNLKAAAQNIHLDTGTLGWAILEHLVSSESEPGEWSDIWATVTSGKATLLLPLEQASAHEKITPEFVRDHIALCDDEMHDTAPLITLSGLRGVINSETLIISSSLHPSSKLFHDLLSFQRAPLPRSVSSSTPSRIPNPFASFFGHKATASASSIPLPVPPQAQPASRYICRVDVAAFTINRRVNRKEIGREFSKILRNGVKTSLSSAPEPVPAWAIDKVHEFTAPWYPLIKPLIPRSGNRAEKGSGLMDTGYLINSFGETPEQMSDRLQSFLSELERDLRTWASGGAAQHSKAEEGVGEHEKHEWRIQDVEERIQAILESVERTICSHFYDRLFMQPNSDDASHDEALSSRVAALNKLDLGLDHLDIEVSDPGAASEVNIVVKACGDMLTQLEARQAPGDKTAILVAAHKIVVDGLSRLPPIRLRSEAESKLHKQKHESMEGIGVAPIPPSISGPTELKTDEPAAIPVIVEPGTGIGATDEAVVLPESSDIPQPQEAPSYPVKADPTPISGDVLLPIIIFAVVKSNPSRLVSHLLYAQRFRNQSIGGEESYCLINLLAVAEFLENVDLAALGLGDGSTVVSTADLTPIPLNRSPKLTPEDSPLLPPDAGSLRGRVEQQVDAIAGSANKVITGVVDSSFGILRSLLPNTSPAAAGGETVVGPVRPGLGLLRRESGFSIANIAAALPMPGVGKAKTNGEEVGQQLLVVSRPGSVRSSGQLDGENSDGSEDDAEDESDDESADEDDGDDEDNAPAETGDTRSIKSFESMLSSQRREKNRQRKQAAGRKSLTDRLAHMSRSGLAGLKILDAPPPHGLSANQADTPSSSRPESPALLQLAPPKQRFLECTVDDLRLSEVGELLREYRRLVEGIASVGGFKE
ncbi:hypothetical protein BD779DRAFT_1556262 [Infundibulicybe gibba]|nr:hypothetical protein BD779DRAFT_1556262 [Infundibulicybe gibba]